jgi:glycosyltransferase involved in cell wall biosynthesis
MKKSFAYVHNQRMPNEFAFGIYVVKSCQAAQKLGYDSYLLYPNRKQPKYFVHNNVEKYYGLNKKDFNKIPIKVFELPFFNKVLEIFFKSLRFPIITWMFAIKSLLFLNKNKINIIQTTDREIIFLLKFCFWYKPKIIYDVHVEPRVWYEKVFDKLIINRVNLFLVNSKFYKNYYLNQGISQNKFIILPCGFDKKQFIPKQNKNMIRNKLKLPTEKFIIGFIGRFETFGDEKGIEEMLKAVKNLKQKIPISMVAVGGPEKLVKKYRLIAKKYKLSKSQAIIKSQVKPTLVADHIVSFDVACMLYPDTHHYKDKMSPQKAIEYMAMNKPVIATNLPSVKQLLSNEMAYLVKVGSQGEFEKTIIDIYKNRIRAQKKAKLAYKYVQQFEWIKRQNKIFKKLG